MKLGSFDGSPKEIRDLIKDNGSRLEEYLEKQPTPLKEI